MSVDPSRFSTETKAKFDSFLKTGKQYFALFVKGFVSCLDDLDPDWKNLTGVNQRKTLNDAAKGARLFVLNKDGGLSQGTLNTYVRRASNALDYEVDLSLAWQATRRELVECDRIVRRDMKDDSGTYAKKMNIAFTQIEQRKEAVRRSMQARAGTTNQVANGTGAGSSSSDPNQAVHQFVRDSIAKIQVHLKARLNPKSERFLRQILGEMEKFSTTLPTTKQAPAAAVVN